MEKAILGLKWTFLISKGGHLKTLGTSATKNCLVVLGRGALTHQRNSTVGTGLSVSSQTAG